MRNTVEHDEQAAFVAQVLYQYRNDPTFIEDVFFSVPNGAYLGGRGHRQMYWLKAEGVRPGVSDILYLQARGDYNCLAMEFKAPSRYKEKRGGVTDEQENFLLGVIKGGGRAVVCYGADVAINVFDAYMKLEATMQPVIGIDLSFLLVAAPEG